ncbi:MAG TPA: PorV/PorQ family protein [Longimicrobiales bacterium]|nr:PorV/PorQ family protein [Longimicrobiales bacterium]
MPLPARSLLAVLLGLALGGDAAAQGREPSSTEGAPFLLLPVGAQAVSMGRAMTALRSPEAAFWNPAGLAGIEESQAVLLRGDHAVGAATALSLLAARPGVGTLGLSYLLLDIGDLDLTDADSNVLGTISVRNHLGVVSAAARLLGRLDAGVNFKVVQFRLSCRGICPDAGTTATTYAMDAGVQLEPSADLPLRFGAMVAHVGPRMQVLNAEQADPLPSRVRVGAAYDVLTQIVSRDDIRGWLSVEVQDRLQAPGSLSLYLGSELAAGAPDALYLRTGYVIGDLTQENGARVGLGLRFERFDLAIAKSLAVYTVTGETEPVHVSFSIVF